MGAPRLPSQRVAKSPVRFDCHGCGKPWFNPPDIGCPRCGPAVPCDVDPRLWDVGGVPGHHITISAHLRDEARTRELYNEHGIRHIVDIANDPHQAIVWRPSKQEAENAYLMQVRYGIWWHYIPGVHDSKDSKPFPLESLLLALSHLRRASRESPVLIHCAAGLRRAPHFVYAYLRTLGLSQDESWGLVEEARPLAHLDEKYISYIEGLVTTGQIPAAT